MLGRGGLSAFAQRGLGTLYALLLDFKNGIYQQTRTRTNLLLWSQGMANAVWFAAIGTAAKIGASAVTDPVGGTSAYQINTGTTGGVFGNAGAFVQAGVTIASGVTMTFSVWARSVTGTVAFRIGGSTQNGADAGSADLTATTAWQRFTFSWTTTGAYANANASVRSATAGGAVGDLLLYGAQLEAAPAASAYIPTTSAAVSVTESITVNGAANVNQLYGYTYSRSGAKEEATSTGATAFAANVPAIIPGTGYFARPAYTNLLLWSQDFTNGAWLRGGAPVTTTADVSVAPDGSTTADKVATGATTAAEYSLYQGVLVASTAYTVSFFAKAGDYNFAYFRVNLSGTYQNTWFNVSNGTVGTNGIAGAVASIFAVGNGWYRCVVSFSTGVGGASGAAFGVAPADGGATNSFTPASAGLGVYVWQAQVVQASDPGPIIVTTSATAAVGADALALSYSLVEQDQLIMGKVTIPDTASLASVKANFGSMFELGDGTTSNRFTVFSNSGGLTNLYISAGGATIRNSVQIGTTVFGVGTQSFIARRRGGKWTIGWKDINNSLTIEAEGAATAMTLGSKLFVGENYNGATQPSAIIPYVAMRPGTFSDTDLTNILTAL